MRPMLAMLADAPLSDPNLVGRLNGNPRRVPLPSRDGFRWAKLISAQRG